MNVGRVAVYLDEENWSRAKLAKLMVAGQGSFIWPHARRNVYVPAAFLISPLCVCLFRAQNTSISVAILISAAASPRRICRRWTHRSPVIGNIRLGAPYKLFKMVACRLNSIKGVPNAQAC